MIKAMTRLQKIIAYSTLLAIIFWFFFGLFTIWLLLTEY
jgi:hypothetical protein